MLLLLLACADPDCETTTFFVDADGDGFGGDAAVEACESLSDAVELSGDCDDADADVHPDAIETCLTLGDDNCDGALNDAEDAGTWFHDEDQDGWGGAEFRACAMPVGATDIGGDCDDQRDTVNPDAEETCKTGWDDDCDGSTEGGVDPLPWYADADGDGVGTVEVLACDQPSGTVALAGDCDDSDANLTDSVLATWTALDGTVTDMTSALGGSSSEPAVWVADGSGALRLCPGLWYVQLKVSGHNVDVFGVDDEVILSGGTTFHHLLTSSNLAALDVRRVVFDRAEGGPAVVVDGDALFRDVTFRDNDGDEGTAGLVVQSGEVAIETSSFVDNVGDEGAGFSSYGGTVTLSDTLFSGNEAATQGGALYTEATVTLDGCDVRDNHSLAGGGMVSLGTLHVIDSKVRENEAVNRGAGAWVGDDSTLVCTSTGGSYGFWGNVAGSGGAVFLNSSTSGGVGDVFLESEGCDWTNGDDNSPNDVGVSHNTGAYNFGDNSDFTCWADGC
jgi:predicted outer membrane repeat protein